ncbi:MAG: preprotein translocase subunit SecG [Tissierellia bacterium]|nr:preprotein translocase subunit SecG [Tissierellia bacterium]
MSTVLSIIVALASLVIIVSVVVQESEQAGLGTLDGSVADSSWGANRGTSKKQMLQRITTISAVVFILALIALAAIH